MLGIKAGDLLEICERCYGCGRLHPCGEEGCQHDFAFAIEDETLDKTVLARFFLEDRRISTHLIVATKWMGWVPDEIHDAYFEWHRSQGDWDDI